MSSLVSFAIKSLGSCSHEFQLAGVRVLDSLLQRRRDSSKELITSEVTKSNKAVTILIGMLGRTAVRHKHIRLFAARVTAELASSLRIAVVPGLLSLVSSLLETKLLEAMSEMNQACKTTCLRLPAPTKRVVYWLIN